ncbi:PBP1A family penicillin-binding protein [Ectobacillus antri]|jgi:penicillin-binding protein 2A|uniref:PBP1A family penicillin-binding protein n=1 Tax=Ectobacillus antri TaxID=2486280 RepID=A0ABT6H7Q2_9BACI|nr:PBP1A family penicillin-binding protein [Ectobacillus antri]MDG4657373.1 PBP1A family penicillin-binding protein [Ectobacillus antri]MDG5754496.1 PBP1A family penicillin-binding protein [Ectobacillus antri]
MGRMERRQQQAKEKKKLALSKSLLWKIGATGIAVILLGVLVFNIFIWKSDVSKLDTPAPQPTIIYDQNGKVASEVSATNIEGITLKEIPKDMVHAVISTEDQRFYKHGGVNYFGIAKAFIQNTVSGEIVAGGSTITQQLAKNAFLSQERTYTRKLQELVLAKKIERTYSKDEIIERYLNQIYFGEGAWGIQRAAQTYFGKDAKDLTLNECATLAGLIKAPSALSPFKNPQKSKERRDVVLSLMKQEGYITENQFAAAKAEKIVLTDKRENNYTGTYPHYLNHIIDEAIKKYDLSANEVLSGGLHIYTELNTTMQEAAEAVYKNTALFPRSSKDQIIQSSAVFINPETGGIQALIGGRGEYQFRQFNYATQLTRQPGSTMKPLAVYAPAIEKGYDVFDKLEDRPLNINGYQPLNYDKRFRGEVTMYDALIESYNVPAVWLFQKLGAKYATDTVKRFGIKLDEEDYNPALSLGGMVHGTSPLAMAQAFSAFPNDGTMMEAHAITRIEDTDGQVIAKWKKKSTKVVSSETAQKLTYMMRGVVTEGTGVKARISGREIAGKTGTTQLPIKGIDGAKDHWFVGYTPQVVGAVWLGYENTDASHYLSSSSGSTSAVIFREIISRSAKVLPEKKFDLPVIEKELRKQIEKREKLEEERREAERKKQEEEKARKEEEEKARKEEEERLKKEQEEKEKKDKEEKDKDKNKDNQDDEDAEDAGNDEVITTPPNTTDPGNGGTIPNTPQTTQ